MNYLVGEPCFPDYMIVCDVKSEYACSLYVYEIIGTGPNGDLDFWYMKKNYQSSDDLTNNIHKAQIMVDISVRWDHGTEWHFQDDAITINDPELLASLSHKVFEVASKEIKKWEKYD